MADYEATIASLQAMQSKIQSENNDLSQQLGDAESKVGSLSKSRSTLEGQVEELRSELQSESSVSVHCTLHQ